jgi:tetratricopeptide (TPR) repeat protein
MGRIDDGLAAWNEAVHWDPARKSTVRELYTMLTNAGLYAEAQRYIDLDENPVQKGFQQGLIAQMTGNTAKAKAEWQAVAELDPGLYQSGHDCWIEATLRLGDSERALQRLQDLMPQLPTSPRLLTLAGMAWAMRGDTELAGGLFQQAINQLRRNRPPKQKLDGADWRLLNSLAIGDESKTALKSYFAAIETVWG